jgi:hypothetical protein
MIEVGEKAVKLASQFSIFLDFGLGEMFKSAFNFDSGNYLDCQAV